MALESKVKEVEVGDFGIPMVGFYPIALSEAIKTPSEGGRNGINEFFINNLPLLNHVLRVWVYCKKVN